MGIRYATIVSSPENGFIWIDGRIEPGDVAPFRRELNRVKRAMKPGTPITLYIRGPGGGCEAVTSLLRHIEEFPWRVNTVAHTEVGSASFLLTQAGASRFAVPGTLFHFHRARIAFKRDVEYELTVEFCRVVLEVIRDEDAESLAIFGRRGRPLVRLQELLMKEATIHPRTARRLRLIDGMWPREIFLRHRRIARRLIRSAKRSS